MNSVQRFIEENQHQLGHIMSEASRKWIENDPIGAFTVGDCNFVVNKYGQYHELLDTIDELEFMVKGLEILNGDYEDVIDKLSDENSDLRYDIESLEDTVDSLNQLNDMLYDTSEDSPDPLI